MKSFNQPIVARLNIELLALRGNLQLCGQIDNCISFKMNSTAANLMSNVMSPNTFNVSATCKPMGGTNVQH